MMSFADSVTRDENGTGPIKKSKKVGTDIVKFHFLSLSVLIFYYLFHFCFLFYTEVKNLVATLLNTTPDNRPTLKQALKHPWFAMTD